MEGHAGDDHPGQGLQDGLQPLGDVLVQGGRFFQEPTRARLTGASLGGSFLKLRGIYVGFSMELWCEGETVVTSPVQTIEQIDTDDARH